ncbi:MAG: nucleoside 2-deoxyribosyltransferase [Acidobacteriota bacterium]
MAEGRMKLYLASPLGFAASTAAYREELHEALSSLGVDVVDPWDSAMAPPRTAESALAIGRLNFRLIDACDAVLAVLDGSDIDSGTACEVGYARARGLVVHGLRSDVRLSGEYAELGINLQVACAVIDSGGKLLCGIEDLSAIEQPATAAA